MLDPILAASARHLLRHHRPQECLRRRVAMRLRWLAIAYQVRPALSFFLLFGFICGQRFCHAALVFLCCLITLLCTLYTPCPVLGLPLQCVALRCSATHEYPSYHARSGQNTRVGYLFLYWAYECNLQDTTLQKRQPPCWQAARRAGIGTLVASGSVHTPPRRPASVWDGGRVSAPARDDPG